MTLKEIREIISDEQITTFINDRYETNHIEVNDEVLIAWDVQGRVCFAYFNEDCDLVTEAMNIRREQNLKTIIEEL